MKQPTYAECLVEAELRARAAYAEPHRHYHDQRHLDDCLEQLAQVHGLSERDSRLLRWAILWHDGVYTPGLHDNEERSAELAERELAGCGIYADDAAEVARLIRLTEHHDPDGQDDRGALMVSIDLSIVGANPQRYLEYAADVRREYGHVPDALWRAGRARVLEHLLDRHPLFPEPRFAARLEAQARSNMEAELRALREG